MRPLLRLTQAEIAVSEGSAERLSLTPGSILTVIAPPFTG